MELGHFIPAQALASIWRPFDRPVYLTEIKSRLKFCYNLFIHFVHICINYAGSVVQYAPRAGAVHARTLIIQPPAGVLCRNAAVRE